MKKRFLVLLLIAFLSSSAYSQLSVVKKIGKDSENSKLGFGVFGYWSIPLNEIGNRNIMIELFDFAYFTGAAEMYSVAKDEKIYLRFRGIDTLFYMDYASDTAAVQNVSRPGEKKNIAGLECKAIAIKTAGSLRTYYYSPSLYMNPEYEKNNTFGQYNVFARETSSLYLGLNDETDSYQVTQTCTRMQQQPIDDAVFKLPDLPVKMFTAESIMTAPKLRGSVGWEKYLQANLNNSLAAKYLKIPRGESGATQTAVVVFMINDKGRVENAQVMNKKEVHPKLAEEALRVVNASPLWTPAVMLDEKVIYWYKQFITFSVTK